MLRQQSEKVRWNCAVAVLLCSMLAAANDSQDRNFPALEGPYMGQPAPGMKAQVFAPGVISTPAWELEGVFAPGMREFYFTTMGGQYAAPTVIGFRQEKGRWTKYIEFARDGEVSFSPDGQRMHMAEGYKDRIGTGWSERQGLGPMFEREDWGVMRLSTSAKGTYVFDDYKSGDVIRISTLKDGKRQQPKEMGPEINTGQWTAHPFIAPDESYLIWDSEREGGFGESDLYISFRQDDLSWGPAINMGSNINSERWEAFASVTPDGKAILFNRGMDPENENVDIYWVSAEVIDQLRPEPSDPAKLGPEFAGMSPEIIAALQAIGLNREQATLFGVEMQAFSTRIHNAVGQIVRSNKSDKPRKIKKKIARLFKELDEPMRPILTDAQWIPYLKYKRQLSVDMRKKGYVRMR